MNKWLLGSLGTFGAGGLVAIVLVAQVAQVPQEQTPYIDFAVTSEEWLVEVGQLVHFHIENIMGVIIHFFWEFHDGTPTQQAAGSATALEHAFAQPGYFLVTVVGASSHSITAIRTHAITVVPSLPTVTLQASQTLVAEDQPLLLTATLATNQPLDAPLVYEWNFGDGDRTTITSETGQAEVVHPYRQAGMYWAQVVVTGEGGVRAGDAMQVNVTNVSPLAVAEISTATPVEDELVLFDASQSTDTGSDQPSLLYLWDFGDGQMAEGLTQSHRYAAAGTYDATLTVLDNDGAASTAIISLEVQNQAPEFFGIEAANTTLFEGQTFIFYGNATDTPSDRAQLAYDWNFGTAGKAISLISFINGNLNIDATVTDDNDAMTTSPAPLTAEIVNVPPAISLVDATTTFNLTFIMTGEKWHDVEFQVMQEDTVLKNATLFRIPDDPWEQSITFTDLTLNLGVTWHILGNYTPENDPINGQPLGATPARAIFFFADGSNYTAHHTFNAEHPTTYLWELPVNPLGWGFLADLAFWVHDPGQDTVDVYADFGGTMVTHTAPAATWGPTQGLVHLQGHVGNVSENPLRYWAIDEDGAHSALTTVPLVVDASNVTIISSFAPQVIIVGDMVASEDAWMTFTTTTQPMMNPQALTQTWLFGDGSGAIGSTVHHSYPVAGLYLVRVAVSDGLYTTMTSSIVEITNLAPSPSMTVPSQTYPDHLVPFDARNTTDTVSDQLTLTYWWDFGDGSYGTGIDPQHAYGHHGTYQAVLVVTDDQGVVSSISQEIQVLNQPPQIADELSVQEDEGTTAVLDPQVTDSLEDMAQLQFQWTLDSIAAQARPISTFALADGDYAGELMVIDPLGANLSVPFTVEITNDAPQGILLDHRVYGPTNRYLRVYGMITDSIYDQSALTYRWRFPANPASAFSEWLSLPAGILDAAIPLSDLGTQSHVLEFEISDSATSLMTTMVLLVTEDTDGDLLPDFFEEQPTLNSNVANPDTDGDGIADPFEEYQDEDSDWLLDATELYIGTDTTNPDTDGDGLWDGYNPLHETGELVRGTDPFDPDTDDDLLSDGVEVLGWEITVEYADGRTQVERMTANPLELHSDTDAVNDTMEFLLAGNPWVVDTDDDELDDAVEAFVWQTALNQADTDHDSLNDYLEVTGWARWVQYYEPTGEFSEAIFTFTSDPHKPDSDGDGLADGDEAWTYFGNPLSNDTDNDGLVDPDELNEGTGLNWADSDGDLLPDGREVHGWSLTVRSRQSDGTYSTYTLPITTDPLNATDSDGDEVADIEEYRSGGNPHMVDTDNDGLTDREEHVVTHTSLNLAFHTTTQTTGQLYLNHTHVDSLWTSEVAVKDQFDDPILPFTRTAEGLIPWNPPVWIYDAQDWDFTNNRPKIYYRIIDGKPWPYWAPPIKIVSLDAAGMTITSLGDYYDKLVLKFLGSSALGYGSSVAAVEPGYQVSSLLQHNGVPGTSSSNWQINLEDRLFKPYLDQFLTNESVWNAAWSTSGSERQFTWGPSSDPDKYAVRACYIDWDRERSLPYIPWSARFDSYGAQNYRIKCWTGSAADPIESLPMTKREFLRHWIGLKLRPIAYNDIPDLYWLFNLPFYTLTLIRDWHTALGYTPDDFAAAKTNSALHDTMNVTIARTHALLRQAIAPGATILTPPSSESKKNWWDKDWCDPGTYISIAEDLIDIASDFLGDVMELAFKAAKFLFDTAVGFFEGVGALAIDLWDLLWGVGSEAIDPALDTVEKAVQSLANLAIEVIVQELQKILTTAGSSEISAAKTQLQTALNQNFAPVAASLEHQLLGIDPVSLLGTLATTFKPIMPYVGPIMDGNLGSLIAQFIELPFPLEDLINLIGPDWAMRLLMEIIEAISSDLVNNFWDDLGTNEKDLLATLVPQTFFETYDWSDYGNTVSVDENQPSTSAESPDPNMADGVHISSGSLMPGTQGAKQLIENLEAAKANPAWLNFVSLFADALAPFLAGIRILLPETHSEHPLAMYITLSMTSSVLLALGNHVGRTGTIHGIGLELILDIVGIASELAIIDSVNPILEDSANWDGRLSYIANVALASAASAIGEISEDIGRLLTLVPSMNIYGGFAIIGGNMLKIAANLWNILVLSETALIELREYPLDLAQLSVLAGIFSGGVGSGLDIYYTVRFLLEHWGDLLSGSHDLQELSQATKFFTDLRQPFGVTMAVSLTGFFATLFY